MAVARRSLPRSTQLRDISEEHARNMAFNVTRELALKDRRAFADELHASNKTSFYKHYSRQTIHEHIISGSRDQSLSTLLVSIKTAHESLNVQFNAKTGKSAKNSVLNREESGWLCWCSGSKYIIPLCR
jgi:hypothetical protein